MLTKVAGPFPVTFMGAARKLQHVEETIWHDDLGLVAEVWNTSVGPTGYDFGTLVQIDGTAYARKTAGIDGRPSHNLRTGGLSIVSGVDFYDECDIRILRATASAPTFSTGPSTAPWTTLPDGRRIHAYAGVVKVREEDGSTSPEYLLHTGGGGPSGFASITPGRGGVVFIGFKSGVVYEYDWRSRRAVGQPRYVPASLVGPFYSAALGVFLTVTGPTNGPHSLNVYADEVAPDSISTPAPTAPIVPGIMATVRTRVLGDHGEPCAGWPIAWTLTGDDATLDAPQSLTDADGWASIGVRVDPTATAGAGIEVGACLTF